MINEDIYAETISFTSNEVKDTWRWLSSPLRTIYRWTLANLGDSECFWFVQFWLSKEIVVHRNDQLLKKKCLTPLLRSWMNRNNFWHRFKMNKFKSANINKKNKNVKIYEAQIQAQIIFWYEIWKKLWSWSLNTTTYQWNDKL